MVRPSSTIGRTPMLRKIPMRVIATYWRYTRGATLGAQGVVIDEVGRVLLVRHGYRPGWHFPGGGIEWRETAETALTRELFEEAGVILKGPARLHGFFSNFAAMPNDHVALFVASEWERPRVPEPNHEIAESRFFARDELPEGTVAPVKRRLAEILDGAPVDATW
ncbi:NUDIX domain-containing protein [Rhodomicrobium vannielii ATCC 17100]|nr:NUDIX domain-containing protein [Rhodomicrobium vannielii ATCC 17100]